MISKFIKWFLVSIVVVTLTACGNGSESDMAQQAVGVKKTGQTTSYVDYDDGFYQEGLDPQYTRDDGNNITTDYITGLEWQDDVEAKTTIENWVAAGTYCSDLTLGGFDNWRLPTIVELQSIVIDGKTGPTIDEVAFQNYTTSHFYWSSTTNARSTKFAWAVTFHDGYTDYDDKTYEYLVRCVRTGQ